MFFATICSLFAPLFSCSREMPVNNTPVVSLDLQRYLGQWFEIARYNHHFEKGLTNSTAAYSLTQDGTVKVVNGGYRDNQYHEAVGKAKTTNLPGLLQVSFFGPFYSDYRVMYIDSDYTYALVGSKSSKYLWILSRFPVLPEGAEQLLLNEAKNRGYDTSSLIWVDQSRHMDGAE